MGYRKFDTTTWQDAWFENLNGKSKLLFIYLWTNDVCNQAGMYSIAKKRIEYAVGFEIDDALQDLTEKVQWFPEHQVIWVKNFYRHQTQNDSFRQAAISSIQRLHPDLIRIFIDYNGLGDTSHGAQQTPGDTKDTITPPSPHHGDMVPSSVAVTVTEAVTETETNRGCIQVGGVGEEKPVAPSALVALAGDGDKSERLDPPVKNPQPVKPKDQCPHDEIVMLYHEILPDLPKVTNWNGEVKKSLSRRWREDKARQKIDWWDAYFHRVANSDFLTGRKTDWRASLVWLVAPKNMDKVLNGQYDNHDPPIPVSGTRRYPERFVNNVNAAIEFIKMGEEK